MSTVDGNGGLPKVVATHAASGAKVEVYLHGACVTSYVPDPASGQDVLFVSSRAVYDGVKAIRGGIPIAFPQFAAQGPLPMHGVARTAPWTLESVGDGSVTLSLSDSAATRAVWPRAFKLVYRVTFDGTMLGTNLEVHHGGAGASAPAGGPAAAGGGGGGGEGDNAAADSASPLEFEALLHTYFATGQGSIGSGEGGEGTVRICGLAGTKYIDKPSGGTQMDEAKDEFPLVGEVDRIYLTNPAEVTIKGIIPPGGVGAEGKVFRSIKVQRKSAVRDESPGLRQVVVASPLDVVVWNAGPAKCASIADFGPDDWRDYVCVEPGRVSEKVTLPKGKVWNISQLLTPMFD